MSELHLAYPEQDVILRTGATRRRNYADLPFPARMDDVQADLLEERASEALQSCGEWFESDRLASMDEVQKGCLAENGLLNRLDLKAGVRSVAYVDRLAGAAVAVCGQEHLLIRTLQEGQNLEKAVAAGRTLERLLARQGLFAFDPQFGYLTGRAEDAGTGLCPWAILHLPLLAEEKLFPCVVKELANQGLSLGALEEGTGPVGKRYVLSTRSGFGLGEEEQVRIVREAAMQLTGCERELRKNALERQSPALFDRLCRSYAILTSARLMSVREMTMRLSDLRLAVCIGLFDFPLTRIDQTDRALRPCGLRLRTGETEIEAQNYARARILRHFVLSKS